MPTNLKLPILSAAAAALLMLAGCETAKSLPAPVELVTPSKVPTAPVVSIPHLGYFWSSHCALERLVRQMLKLSAPPPEGCATLGLEK
jgi:hypothetical protein